MRSRAVPVSRSLARPTNGSPSSRAAQLHAHLVSFTDDRGGNTIEAQEPCAENLHAVWDRCLIECTLGRDIRHIAAELRAHVRVAERTAWTRTSAKAWANESSIITTAEAVRYCVRTDTGCWC
jgi:S1/P1 Nuclease